jgi:hypothetical protein
MIAPPAMTSPEGHRRVQRHRPGGDARRQHEVLELLVDDDEGEHPEGVDRIVEERDQHRQGAGEVGADRRDELGHQPDQRPRANG